MSINWKEWYPNGAVFELKQRWGKCETCGSGLHCLDPEYDPEDMRSVQPLVCPNCQRIDSHIVKWHSPDGATFDAGDTESFIAHLESIGKDIPHILEPDFDDEDDIEYTDYDDDYEDGESYTQWGGGNTVYHGLDDYKGRWEDEQL